ncbi:MAG: GNAT family N-acetyltransferase [Protaetiibacter sp.]
MERRATASDHDAVVGIERAAGELFREIGMREIADDEPIGAADFDRFAVTGRAWLWEVDGVPAGYLLVEPLDDGAHVEQLSVDPAWGRSGIGTALLQVAARWAEANGLRSLTLTTFRDVPWNAGFYARRGFRILAPDECGPELMARARHESELGLDRWPRVAMRRDLR